jgi:hypothetical protein
MASMAAPRVSHKFRTSFVLLAVVGGQWHTPAVMTLHRPGSFRALCAGAVLLLSVSAAWGAAAGNQPPSARADIEQALSSARIAVAKQAWAEVVKALERGLRRARDLAPLEVRQAVLVREPHAGLGAWTALDQVDGAAVVYGRSLRLYVEVDDVVDAPTADGRRRVALHVMGRFTYVEGDGTRTDLGEKELGRQELALWRTTGVHSFGVDVALSEKAPPGRYELVLVVVDEIGQKRAEKAVTFLLR